MFAPTQSNAASNNIKIVGEAQTSKPDGGTARHPSPHSLALLFSFAADLHPGKRGEACREANSGMATPPILNFFEAPFEKFLSRDLSFAEWYDEIDYPFGLSQTPTARVLESLSLIFRSLVSFPLVC